MKHSNITIARCIKVLILSLYSFSLNSAALMLTTLQKKGKLLNELTDEKIVNTTPNNKYPPAINNILPIFKDLIFIKRISEAVMLISPPRSE